MSDTIDALAAQIRHHRDRYYRGEEAEISDAEFDAIEDRLRALAPDHPVLAEVGAPPEATATLIEVETPGLTAQEAVARLVKLNAESYQGKPSHPEQYLAAFLALRKADPQHPLLGQVAPPRGFDWPKARHEIPMGSLNKVNTIEELVEWAERCDELAKEAETKPVASDLMCTEKLDGLSLEVVYEDGAVVAAITRGDGVVGERITSNVMRMQGVPEKITHVGRVSVRGEIILKKKDAEAFVELRRKVDPIFDLKSLRNSAAGIARTKDLKLLPGCKLLSVLCYDVEPAEQFTTEKEKISFLSEQGFETPAVVYGDVASVAEEWKRYEGGARKKLGWEIDGLVVRANDLTAAALLGELNNRPRGAVAFKFGNEMGVTTLREVMWSTGDTGRITPIAQLDPAVFLAGAEVRQASLHNAANVKKLGIGPGDQVLVSRRNDVIPYVEKIVVKGENHEAIPAACGVCKTPVSIEGEYLVCRNDDCPARRVGRLRTWIAHLGFLGWGEEVVYQIWATGLAKEPADLYRLTVEQLSELKKSDGKTRFGKKTAEKLLEPLLAQKEIPMPTFIAGLGIDNVSRETAKLLVGGGLDTFEKLAEATVEQIAEIHGLGPIKAEKIKTGIMSRLEEVRRLGEEGVVATRPAEGGPLAGLRFCFSGSSERPRKELEQIVEKNGGDVASSITKGVTHLVLADPASASTKAQKAKKLGTEIIAEAAFIALVTERGGHL